MQGSPAEVQAYKQLLQDCINEKGLHTFYPQGTPVLDQIAQQAAGKINQVIQRWRVQKEIANDIVKLALYDIVLYIDDSGSMQFEEEGSRIKDLRLILERVSFAATLFDVDGISIRFMNTDLSGVRDQQGRPLQDGVATEAQIEQIMRGVQFKGLTPMGTSLRKKVIDEIVLSRAQQGQLRKPILVIAITDGQPAGEPQNAVFDTIRYAFETLQQRLPQYGRGGVAFEFAQVGNDEMAKKFLAKLDEDPQIGPMIDCTSSRFPLARSIVFEADLSSRLRERARRDVPRQPSGRPHSRSMDHQAPSRCHRPLLRFQGREDQPCTWRLWRLRRTPRRRLRRTPPAGLRWPTPAGRPVRCSPTRPVRCAPRPAAVRTATSRRSVWTAASAKLWPAAWRIPAAGSAVWRSAAAPASGRSGRVPRSAAVWRTSSGLPWWSRPLSLQSF